MKIDGYVGICSCCFEPIKEGVDFQFYSGGMNFHKQCVNDRPESYYVKLEEIKSRFLKAQQKELPELMTEMEYEFKIPLLNDEAYNQDNPLVITLYREISYARIF